MLAAPFLLMAGSLLFIAWRQLRRDKYIKLKILPFVVEQDSQGNLYRTRVGGTCGLCNHPIRLISYDTHTRAECTNYPQDHWWKFQSSVLPDTGDNYNDSHGN